MCLGQRVASDVHPPFNNVRIPWFPGAVFRLIGLSAAPNRSKARISFYLQSASLVRILRHLSRPFVLSIVDTHTHSSYLHRAPCLCYFAALIMSLFLQLRGCPTEIFLSRSIDSLPARASPILISRIKLLVYVTS